MKQKMINNFISRVIVIANVSILINIVLIDGLMSNIIQIGLIDSKFKNHQVRQLFQSLFSLGLLLSLIYVLFTICFNKFLLFITTRTETGEVIKPTKLNLVVFVLVPVLVWCLLFVSLVNLYLNRDLYTAQMYHKQPVSYRRKSDLDNTISNIKSNIKNLKSKLTFFNKKDSNNEEYDLNDEMNNKLNDLPWFILSLNESQALELDLKYYKYCLFTFINIILYALLFIGLNVYAKIFIR